ncbi:YciI family protein [Ornithinibacillus scapharcae]|uniref:YciI family protein n=1 Tax=Ornithinibacillus scapharcae TaxID=1147159 RepID=UPI000225AD70|nr:YciI family protein [Ornithinibacillus scapharcae]
MKYFAVFLPMKDEEKSKQHRPEHLAFLQGKLEEGYIFAKGPFVDGAGGLVIYQANSLEEAEAIVKQDPYVIIGARGYEIHEWQMTQ